MSDEPIRPSRPRPRLRPTRRTFLTALGLGGAGLLLPSLGGRRTIAEDSIPKRFLLLWSAHGTVRSQWKIDRPGLPTDRDVSFDLGSLTEAEMSPILRPLHRHRDKLLVLEGLAQTSALADEVGNNHFVARSHLLTGAPYRSEDRARPTAMSIDQRIADTVRREGRFDSIELGTNRDSVITRERGEVLPTQTDPAAAFELLFPPDASTAEPTVDERVRRERRSVLDFVAGEYERTMPRLSGDDRRKLEQHRDLVRDLESRIGALAGVTCGRPELASAETRFEHFARIASAALACDLTRVASIQMGQLDTAEFGAPAGTDVHQDWAHNAREGAEVPADESAAARMQREDALRWMTEYNLVHARQLAFLLDLLDSVPEGDGTLLDHTCVLWLTELSTGTHELRDMPVVMAGGCGGAFETGRYLRYAQNRPMPQRPWGPYPPIGPAHSHLLVSIARAMGAELDALPMTEATGADGERIDLTGPLAGLAG
ncbi:MAG TPA: DUF1552 domain-containing protein [Sandaracinaceae bacterium LLY-WYZ-13_1]|nr:DUF1552 domain-containing protein [Sandaracinaceae bacterium LLY-WYZ-13_1]